MMDHGDQRHSDHRHGDKHHGEPHHDAQRGESPDRRALEHAARVAEEAARHDADENFCVAARARSEELYARRSAKAAASRAAYEAGEKAEAAELSREAKALGAEAEAAAAAAAQEIFDMKNARMGPYEVDLHGLRVAEAVGFVERRLEADASARGNGGSCVPGVVFIYGAGHHSAGGQQHLKPAVLAALEQRRQQDGDAGLGEVREDWDAISGRANPGCVSVVYAPGGSLEALLHAQHGGAATPAAQAASPVVHPPATAGTADVTVRVDAAPHSAPDVAGGAGAGVGLDAVAVQVAPSPAGTTVSGDAASAAARADSDADIPHSMSLREFLAHGPPPQPSASEGAAERDAAGGAQAQARASEGCCCVVM